MSDDATRTAQPDRAWQTVLAHLEAHMLSGGLGPGDRLPAERALAADLGVARSSVREAMRVLEAIGLVRTQTGSGPQSGAIIIARPRGGMEALLRLQVAARGFDVADVMGTRVVLESAVAEDLARRSDAAARTAAAREVLDVMDREPLTVQEFLALDAQFHYALAEASGNAVIASTMAGLRESIERYILDAATRLPSWAETSERLRREHRAILAAIESGRPEAARESVRRHITDYYAESDRAAPLPRHGASPTAPAATPTTRRS